MDQTQALIFMTQIREAKDMDALKEVIVEFKKENPNALDDRTFHILMITVESAQRIFQKKTGELELYIGMKEHRY